MPIDDNEISNISIMKTLDVTDAKRESIDQFVANNSSFDSFNDFKDSGVEEMMWDWTLGHLQIDS